MSQFERTRVAIACQEPIVGFGLTEYFNTSDNVELVANVEAGASVQSAVSNAGPDLLIWEMPSLTKAPEMVARLLEISRGLKVLIFSASTNVDEAIRVLDAGAAGYLLKTSSLETIEDAICQIMLGNNYISPDFATKVITHLKVAAMRKAAAEKIGLSVREEQVLRYLLRGQTNREIAMRLKISEKTVKHYMAALMQKMNARNRVEVVIAAQELGHLPGSSHRKLN